QVRTFPCEPSDSLVLQIQDLDAFIRIRDLEDEPVSRSVDEGKILIALARQRRCGRVEPVQIGGDADRVLRREARRPPDGGDHGYSWSANANGAWPAAMATYCRPST